jgi:hypothetical protein
MSTIIQTTVTISAERPRLWPTLIFPFQSKSVRERADAWLFVAGLIVEYYLLFDLFLTHTGTGIKEGLNCLVIVLLVPTLAFHQFLIFRNSTLQYTLPVKRSDFLELLICLFFGVLTGELGYLLVLTICSRPDWLTDDVPPIARWLGASIVVLALAAIYSLNVKPGPGKRPISMRMCLITAAALLAVWVSAKYLDRDMLRIRDTNLGLQWVFAEHPLPIPGSNTPAPANPSKLAKDSITWFVEALGRMLKAVFASGATALSVLIFVWDWMVRKSFPDAAVTASEQADQEVQRASNRTTWKFFCAMDGLAVFTWAMVLGVVLPTTHQDDCFYGLALVSFVYALVAGGRLYQANATAGKLSTERVAVSTVI